MTTKQKLLNALSTGEDVSHIQAVTKTERILKRICMGESCDDIEAITKEEKLCKQLSIKMSEGGLTEAEIEEILGGDY